MKRFISKPYRWAALYTAVLILFTAYVLLDTFTLSKRASTVGNIHDIDYYNNSDSSQGDKEISDNYYKDSNITISISTICEYDTHIYIADIKLSSASYIKTALANNEYGRNIKQTTSEIAENNDAILAINGDYYGFRDYGYVIRNGILFRDNGGCEYDDLVINADGSFQLIDENDVSAKDLLDNGAMQVLSFGPSLIDDGKIKVTENEEVAQAMVSNPRTAIGMIEPLHYIIVVSDGRTSESAGLTLYQLAQVMQDQGCTVAYNLDGGGSSTMYFNGKIINNPTDGHKMGERKVSDIVYIGY